MRSLLRQCWLKMLALQVSIFFFRFLGVFAKLRKATISFVMSARLSVPPHGTTAVPLDGFSWNFIFAYSSKTSEKTEVSLKSDTNNRHFTWRPLHIFLSHLAQFFLEWEGFETKVLEEITKHILCSVTFSRKWCSLWDNEGKILYSTAGHRWQCGACALHAG